MAQGELEKKIELIGSAPFMAGCSPQAAGT